MDEARQTFSRKERLRRRKEFLHVYERGRKLSGKHFFLFFLGNGFSYNRLGVTVSRKVGDTVLRNRLKRRLREIYRKNKLAVSPGCDVVVNVKRSAADAAFAELERDFLRTAARWTEA